MTARSSASFAIGGVEPKFACITCGCEVGGIFPLEVRGQCCKCAGEHLEWECGYCIECGEPREYDPCDDDVGLFTGYHADEPIGRLASTMNGNAAVANASRDNRQAWDNWVAFCESNGHP